MRKIVGTEYIVICRREEDPLPWIYSISLDEASARASLKKSWTEHPGVHSKIEHRPFYDDDPLYMPPVAPVEPEKPKTKKTKETV